MTKSQQERITVNPFNNESLWKAIGIFFCNYTILKFSSDERCALDEELEMLEAIRFMFNNALEKADTKNTARADGKVKYSIANDSDGGYVKVDANQKIFDGKNIREMPEIACRFIKAHFKGKVLSLGEYGKVYVNKRSAEEYAYPANRRISDVAKEAKMRVSAELDNFLAVSKFVEHQDDDGGHPQATGGWDVYSTRFEVANIMFRGDVKIMNTERGSVFYDVTKIEKLPVNGGQTEYNSVAASGNLSIDSILDSDEIVNNQYMQNGEKNAPEMSLQALNSEYMKAVENGDTETAQKYVDGAAARAGYTIRAYHGTGRGDRVGNVFLLNEQHQVRWHTLPLNLLVVMYHIE